MGILVENKHDDSSSNPGWVGLQFTERLDLREMYECNYSFTSYGKNSSADLTF